MTTAEDIIKSRDREIFTVPPDTPLQDAVKLMVNMKIGAILVKENDNIVGIWSERDLMRNVLIEGFDIRRERVEARMSTNLHYIPHTATISEMMDRLLGLFVRHLLVEKNGEFIGFISSGDVMRATLLETEAEYKKLQRITSWEYYENWKWGRKDR